MNYYELSEKNIHDDVDFILSVITASGDMFRNVKKSANIVKPKFLEELCVPCGGFVKVNEQDIYLKGDVVYTIHDIFCDEIFYTYECEYDQIVPITFPEKLLYKEGESIIGFYKC